MNSEQEIKELLELRKKIFIAGYKGGMAHLASCYSSLEMIYAMYLKGILKYDRKNPKWKDRDRFILSKGHAGLALYGVMEEAGLISDEIYKSYLTENSLIGGEPCMRDSQWVEATTGSLGHGLSMGLGIAMALKMNNSPAKVYVMLGDGELEEGTVWEAIMTVIIFKKWISLKRQSEFRTGLPNGKALDGMCLKQTDMIWRILKVRFCLKITVECLG